MSLRRAMIRATMIPTDADAAAYLAAVEATGATVSSAAKKATHKLFADLKAHGIYTKIKAMYPFLGGTAAAHKFNAINPTDSDAAFRLTFYNSPTHSSSGVAWNGTSQYADTHFVPSNHFTDSTGSAMGYYSTVNSSQGDVYEIGSYNSSSKGHFLSVYNGAVTGGPKPFISQYTGAPLTVSLSDTRGFFVMRRNVAGSASGNLFFRNGAVLVNSATTIASQLPPTVSTFLGVMNVNGAPYGYSNRGCSFAFISETLSTYQITVFSATVQNFQKALDRQFL